MLVQINNWIINLLLNIKKCNLIMKILKKMNMIICKKRMKTAFDYLIVLPVLDSPSQIYYHEYRYFRCCSFSKQNGMDFWTNYNSWGIIWFAQNLLVLVSTEVHELYTSKNLTPMQMPISAFLICSTLSTTKYVFRNSNDISPMQDVTKYRFIWFQKKYSYRVIPEMADP